MTGLPKLAMLLVLLVGACSTVPQGSLITGSLNYRGEGSVPSNATAEITVIDPARQGAPLLSQSVPAGDGHAAVPFSLSFAREQLPPGPAYALQARVRDPGGSLLWISHSNHAIDAAQPRQDVGAVALAPVPAKPSLPKPGAKPIQLGYVARGNEPGWMLHIVGRRLMLETDYGTSKLEAPEPPRQKIAGGYRYQAHAGKQTLRVEVIEKVCRDDSGTPFPDTVTVVSGGKTLRGCGGDPAGALQHARWMVRSIDGKDVAPKSRPTLVFEITGRVAGHASCNSYSGPYQVGGENGLRFGNLVATRRACATPLMEQEKAMLAVLNDAVRYDLADDGTLTVETGDGHRLVARKG